MDDVSTSDQELIDQCLAGQTDAFGELVTRYESRLYGTLVHILGSVQEARDATQEAFVLAFRKLKTFRQESAFYSWLFRIAYNAAVSQHRRRQPPTASVDVLREQSGSEPVDDRPESDPAYALHLSERQALVSKALDELGEEFRTVIILREMEGLSYEEIAELVACPVGTVRSRIHRARSELREKLTRALASER
ncbi:MAG: sigma-70 family RNA polymerase sigma factor [Planctomycetaceae bacterium]|nr:sigma-70 family RNA polymerase sigma factor [Planctomycetaceae bacterium]